MHIPWCKIYINKNIFKRNKNNIYMNYKYKYIPIEIINIVSLFL